MRIDKQGYVPNAINNNLNKLTQSSEMNPQSNVAKLNQISGSAKRDTIEISQHTQNERPTLTKAKEQIISGLKQEKDPAFLADLKAKIDSGSYQIDTKELAGLLLDQLG